MGADIMLRWTTWAAYAALPAMGIDPPVGEVVDASDDECVAAYSDRLKLWRSLSRAAPTVYIPKDHRPDWYWEYYLQGQKRSKRAQKITPEELEEVGYSDEWLESLFGQAHVAATGCFVHGGRYWETNLDVTKLGEVLPESSRSVLRASLGRLLPEGAREAVLEGTPVVPVVRMAVCAPTICTHGAVLQRIYPEFQVQVLLGPEMAELAKDFPLAEVLSVEEVWNWDSVQLDFALAGVDNCGTTSLMRNLDKHPEIVFSSTKADEFFVSEVVHRLVPLRWQVEAFHKRLQEAKEKKFKETGIWPTLAGIWTPSLFSFGLARMALRHIDRAKVVMAVCDPLGRLERRFMEFYYCHEDLESAQAQKIANRYMTAEDCFPSASALWNERHGRMEHLILQFSMKAHLESMHSMFYGRMLRIHRDMLKQGERLYPVVAKFVGVKSPLPESTTFGHFNAVGGHRTDLCKNESLVFKLQRLLEPEYRAQVKFLLRGDSPVPDSLTQRISRCATADSDKRKCPATAC